MTFQRLRAAPGWIAAIALWIACGGGGEKEAKTEAAVTEADTAPKVSYQVLGEFISPEDSLPRVRYFESGMVSINDRCAVREVRLNPKMPPVWVNGRPVGFC